MPVFSAVITSKRSRRGRSEDSRHSYKDSADARRLRRKIQEAASVSHSDSTTQEPASLSTKMSTWQANGTHTPTTNGMTLSQNPSINEIGLSRSNSPTKSPPKAGVGDIPSGVERSFQRRRSFGSRKKDVDEILTKHPHKVPIIIERARREKSLALLDKSKFLVPEELTMSQLTTIIRRRLQLSDTQAFYLIINRRTMVSASMTLAEVYRNDKDKDGFLYIVYASQEMFG